MAQPPPSAVTANFPQPVLTPFATEFQPPTHSSLQVLQRELNANAMSVHSNEGGGTFGHLTLTISVADYAAIIGMIPFPPPPAPPAAPVYAVGATDTAIGEAVRLYQEQLRCFQRYHDTDKALVRLIIQATPATYIQTLDDPAFGYANVTTLQMLNHLKTMYGALTDADRDANLARMTAPWSFPTPIEALFKQLEAGQRFAIYAAEPIADPS
jgi:hypothetical protein